MLITVTRYSVLLLLFYRCVTSLIIPEELPTILSLIYSNIPPIKKGTDSRLGVGFRLGEHADFQVLVELGPQQETERIGTSDSKRRRQATLNAAINGEMGPWAQSIAKYQNQLRIQKELEERIRLQEQLKKMQTKKSQSETMSGGGEWLTKWSKGMIEPPGEDPPSERFPIEELLPMIAANGIPTGGFRNSGTTNVNDKMKELQKLYKAQPIAQNA
ncbi:uncharacterized protein snsl isoform X1 [Neodiprion pinetum]|uniref:Uncharacterized protein LOC107224523 isoform X1 n=1 Tax=Neodiprion lecontei TaxID=441921 RepID=A0ABM3FX68_NEOLC|nr:uncharacterized protein LOC124216185 isoform X1 [Neodiprion pinetum]XP_046592606.1 uncharacterized protein LOC107224523 isoform X1 [Neodiprion lecontei]